MAENTIPTTKISEVLKYEFMEPLNLSAYELAKKIDVTTSCIQDLLHDRRSITIDTSIRLGKVFGVSPKFLLNIQNDIDLRNAKIKNAKVYNNIQPIASA